MGLEQLQQPSQYTLLMGSSRPRQLVAIVKQLLKLDQLYNIDYVSMLSAVFLGTPDTGMRQYDPFHPLIAYASLTLFGTTTGYVFGNS